MKKRKKRQCTWYIEPLDPRTNSIIAGNLPEEDALSDMRCADGTSRNLWRCHHNYVTHLIAARRPLNLSFRIFRREGTYGKIFEWQFEGIQTYRTPATRVRVAA